MLTGQAQIHLTEADAQLKEAQARKALADSQAGQPLEPLTMPAAYADLQRPWPKPNTPGPGPTALFRTPN